MALEITDVEHLDDGTSLAHFQGTCQPAPKADASPIAGVQYFKPDGSSETNVSCNMRVEDVGQGMQCWQTGVRCHFADQKEE